LFNCYGRIIGISVFRQKAPAADTFTAFSILTTWINGLYGLLIYFLPFAKGQYIRKTIMAKKSFGLVMLVAVLAFGMAVTGCSNNGDTNVSALDGRWVYAGDPNEVWVFDGGTGRTYYRGVLDETWTFSTSGSNITITLEGLSVTGTFAISGNTLTITLTFYGATTVIVLQRQ